jgi:hypothetical protein
MPTSTQTQAITDALAKINLAKQALDDMRNKTGDTATLSWITAVDDQLTDTATLLGQAQTAADDIVFTQVTTNLVEQANALKASEAKIKKIIGGAKIAGKVLGYIAQGVEIILTKL